MNEKEQLFKLFVICLSNRKRPNAINGDVRAENRAWDDAVYALHYFEREYHEHCKEGGRPDDTDQV